jgi:hypothetical protein
VGDEVENILTFKVLNDTEWVFILLDLIDGDAKMLVRIFWLFGNRVEESVLLVIFK